VTRRFLALGDSYTIGEGVDASERWPVQLAVGLRALGVSLADPLIIAKTGWTTDELLAALDAVPPTVDHQFDLVTLLIGVNDQYRGRDVETFRLGFSSLLTRAVEFAAANPARVLVLSIPDWGVTPFAAKDWRSAAQIAREIDAFNSVARETVLRWGAAFIDVTRDSRRAANDRSLIAADELHPSAAMYASWAQSMLPPAQHALGA